MHRHGDHTRKLLIEAHQMIVPTQSIDIDRDQLAELVRVVMRQLFDLAKARYGSGLAAGQFMKTMLDECVCPQITSQRGLTPQEIMREHAGASIIMIDQIYRTAIMSGINLDVALDDMVTSSESVRFPDGKFHHDSGGITLPSGYRRPNIDSALTP